MQSGNFHRSLQRIPLLLAKKVDDFHQFNHRSLAFTTLRHGGFLVAGGVPPNHLISTISNSTPAVFGTGRGKGLRRRERGAPWLVPGCIYQVVTNFTNFPGAPRQRVVDAGVGQVGVRSVGGRVPLGCRAGTCGCLWW